MYAVLQWGGCDFIPQLLSGLSYFLCRISGTALTLDGTKRNVRKMGQNWLSAASKNTTTIRGGLKHWLFATETRAVVKGIP